MRAAPKKALAALGAAPSLLVPALLGLISGCAGVQAYPYGEAGFGYKIDSITSPVLVTGCDYVTLSPNHPTREFQTASCGGSNPTGHINVGLEFGYIEPAWWKVDRLALEHWSHVFNGEGGSRRETRKNEVVVSWKIGGRPH